MFVPRISCLDRISSCSYLQDEADDVFERGVRQMRYVPASETHVIPNAILGDSTQCVIQGVHAQLSPFTVAFRTLLNQMIVHVCEYCVIHLKKQARAVDFLVFLAQGIGERKDVIFLGW